MAAERATEAPQPAARKVRVSRPGDQEEVEARSVAGGAGAAAARERLGTRSVAPLAAGQLALAPPAVGQALSSPGEPLRPADRAYFERRLGTDLAGVRVHRDHAADVAAHALPAQAFTLGNHIAFADGAFAPHTQDGRDRLTHELVHVLQPDADRVLRRQEPVAGHPHQPTADELIARFTAWGMLDEAGLGQRLFELAWMSPNHYAYVESVIQALTWHNRDDVASAFVRNARDEHLDEFARTAPGQALLTRLKNELVGGFPSGHETGEALRVLYAIRRAMGVAEGEQQAGALMTAAEQRAQSETLRIPLPTELRPDEIEDRIRLLALVLAHLRVTLAAEPAVIEAVNVVSAAITSQRPMLTSLAVIPAFAATRVALGQTVAERAAANLTNLALVLANLRARSDLGVAGASYVTMAERVRGHWLAALRGALDERALVLLSVAEATAATLPQAFTEIDLGIMARRPITEGSGQELVAWVQWMRGRLAVLTEEGRAIAAARERDEPNLTDRETAFRHQAELLSDSIAAAGEWDRAIRAYEALTVGGNLIGGATEDVRTIRERCRAMRDAALAGDHADLRARLTRHRADPAVERFYRAIPAFVGASGMLFGLSVGLVAAAASAGVGALVAVEGASGLAVAGTVALEAMTFTVVSRTLSGVMAPDPRTSLLAELVLNIGLFGLLRGMGAGIRGALAARGLESVTGVATHTASYAVLSGWGILHFRLQEGRWPSGEEIARMSLDNLVMLAGIAVTSGAVVRAIRSQQQLHALETFHARYGERLALIEIGRNRLAGRLRAELAAGRGEDANLLAQLRGEAAELDGRLRTLVDEVKADTQIRPADLRAALADRTIDAEAVGGALLGRSLALPERVGLRRAGGINQYSYEMGATPPLVERLTALGARLTQAANADGRLSVIAEFRGEPPMLFIERAVSPELRARLAELARLIEDPRTSRADRQGVIGDLRTPHGAPERGRLEGFVLDTVLAENQRAFAQLITQLRAENPGAIVGMEQGGAFLVDVIRASDPQLATRVRHMPVHKNARGEKFDGPRQQAEFQRLIDGGARRIAIVDSFMGGTTERALDRVLTQVLRDNPGIAIDIHWLRESMGLRTVNGELNPLRRNLNQTTPEGSRVSSDERTVRLVLGDDVQIVYSRDSREPITLFDRSGRILRIEYPGPGETTRDVLIRMLRPPATAP